jgi:hypothetical protein
MAKRIDRGLRAGDFASSNLISNDGANTVEMIKGSEVRKTDFPIEPLLLDRWSPRAMSGEEISEEELLFATHCFYE